MKFKGLAIIKLLDKLTQSVIMLEVKFMQNTDMLDMMNSSSETLILNPKDVLGILNLKIVRLLQNKAGSVTIKCKHIL